MVTFSTLMATLKTHLDLRMALGAALVLLLLGCGRGRGVPDAGEVIHHDRGFSLVVPPGWSTAIHDDGIRLAAEDLVGEGYPAIRIDALSASQLPSDFLDGRSFRWSGGRGSYRNRRWANSLGNGYALDVHLRGENIYLLIEAEVWDRRLTRDGRYFRKQIWPIVNSIVEED